MMALPALLARRLEYRYTAPIIRALNHLGRHGMATVRKTITLTTQQDAWIAAQIEAGSYTNDSEAIRDLIRREQERSFEVDTIRQALKDGELSGEPEPFDFTAFKQRKTAQHG